MVNVFGESVGSGSVDLQLVKKVITTVGTFGDYTAEINQSYVLGFPLYRLRTNGYGTFVTPIHVYNGKVYVLDDVATMDITKRILSRLMMVVVLLCKEIEDPLELEF